MKNKNLFIKIVFVALIILLLLSLVVPVIFSQTSPKKDTLLNGLKVLMFSDPKADKVSLKVRIHAGSAFDPQGKEGVMQVLSDNLFPTDASQEFFAEDLGGGLEVVTNYDYIQVNASAKPEQFLTMLETIAGAVSNPPIDKENTARLKNVLIAKVKAMEADPAYVADQAVARRLFGTFPYGRPQFGTEASLQKIDFADLMEARQRFLTADNATIAVSGNFDRSLALRAIKRYFGGWLKADKKVPSTFREPDDPDTNPFQIEIPNIQKARTRIAKDAPGRADGDYYAMLMYTTILQRQGCADSERYEPSLLRGIYVVNFERNFADAPKDEVRCPFLVQKKDGRVIHPNVRQDDFDVAKAKVLSSVRDQASLTKGLSDLWLDLDTYKLVSTDDEVRKANAVTLADVRALADRLVASPSVWVFVNPPLKSS